MSDQTELQKRFQEISQNTDHITKAQLKTYLSSKMNEQGKPLITNEEIDHVFVMMDDNHDGKISFEEFCLFSVFNKKIT